jgi:predicted HTH domain antitoxin
MRRKGESEAADARILGSGEFVTKVVQEADTGIKYQFLSKTDRERLTKQIRTFCKKEGMSEKELCSGSRRREVSKARAQLAVLLVKEHGVSLTECARQLGLTTSAIAKILVRFKTK